MPRPLVLLSRRLPHDGIGRASPDPAHASIARPTRRSGADRRGAFGAGASTSAIGARAERAAAAYFVEQGFAIVGANVRVGRLEIDLVLREGAVIAVVEVRTRGPGSWLGPLDSIDARKRARLRAAGERLWRARFAADATLERMRFDAAAVTFLEGGEAMVEHVRAAF